MAGRNHHLSNGSLFFTWLIAGIILLILNTSKVNYLFIKTFGPVLQIGRQVQLNAFQMHPGDDTAVSRAEYNKLLKNYKNMHSQLLQLHDNYEKLAQIKTGLPQPFNKLILARTVNTTSSFSHEIIINQGSDSGIKQGQYVLSAGQNSIVGVVHDTAESLAKVRLLTDSNQSMEIRIRREGADKDIAWVMHGDGKTGCRIPKIPKEKMIKVGDAVFAAARPGFLDVPVIIGEVVNIRPDEYQPLVRDITVQPVENLAQLDDVAVIVAEQFETKEVK